MASPVSKDLFQRAIGESGGAFRSGGLGYPLLAESEARGASFMQQTFGTSDVAELRRVSSDDILRAVVSPAAMAGAVGGKSVLPTTPAPRFGPDVDGYFLPDTVQAIYAAGRQAHVPLLAGWNADEGRGQVISANPPTTAATFTAQANTNFGDQATKFLALYPAGDDAGALNAAADYAGDRFIAFSTWRWLESQVQTGSVPVYHYFFKLGSPGDSNHTTVMGAFHSDEIEYVFGTLDSRAGAKWRPEDRKLSDQMMQYWTTFARTGNPNTPGLPEWPRYEPTKWETMELGVDSRATPDAHRARYLFLDGVEEIK